MKYRSLILTAVFLLVNLSCSISSQTRSTAIPITQTPFLPQATVPPSPQTTWVLPTPLPTASLPPLDSGWAGLHPGLERRTIDLYSENGSLIETLYILRIDPDHFIFDVFYEPIAPHNLQDWQSLTGALVVVNGGYFSKDEQRYYANGLIVVDGQHRGTSYGSFAGMLAITSLAPELRWLEQRPYNPAEDLQAGLQSFPLLVKPGGIIGFPAENEDNLMARRTAIGQDKRGHILLVVAPMGYFTLHKLSNFLVESDLELEIAMNLDGGPSSGILLAEPMEEIPAFSALPIVITVHRR